jgi:hypothetical protein
VIFGDFSSAVVRQGLHLAWNLAAKKCWG